MLHVDLYNMVHTTFVKMNSRHFPDIYLMFSRLTNSKKDGYLSMPYVLWTAVFVILGSNPANN